VVRKGPHGRHPVVQLGLELVQQLASGGRVGLDQVAGALETEAQAGQ
jgi:hypothetical protein